MLEGERFINTLSFRETSLTFACRLQNLRIVHFAVYFPEQPHTLTDPSENFSAFTLQESVGCRNRRENCGGCKGGKAADGECAGLGWDEVGRVGARDSGACYRDGWRVGGCVSEMK